MTQDRVWAAREVVRYLSRAVEGQVRAATPTQGIDATSELARSVTGFVRRHGRLTLEVATDGLRLGDEDLSDEQGKTAALALLLLVGGVRELTLEKGIDADEVGRLLIALAGDEGDAATRILDAGLPHVDVRTIDFIQSLERPEGLSPSATAILGELKKQAEARATAFEAKVAKGPHDHELTDSGDELAKLDRVPRVPPAQPAGPLPVSPEALRQLRARCLVKASPDDVLLSLVDHVLDAYAVDPEAIGVDTAKWLLEAAPALALRQGNLRLLASLLERFAMELTIAQGAVAATVNGIIEGLGKKQSIEKLIAIGTTTGAAEAFCAVLENLGQVGVEAALLAYRRTESKEVRDALNAFLSANVGHCPDVLRPLLEPAAGADTAKWALFLVSKCVKGDAVDTLFDKARGHPEKAVHEYANFLWRTQTTKGRLTALLESLEKSDPAERIRAVDALAKAKDADALGILVKLVEDPAFLNRPPEEMKAYLNAIAAIGGPDMVKFFERQSERSSGIFKIRAGNEVRQQAKEMILKLTGGAGLPKEKGS